MVRGEWETILNSSGDTFLPPPRFSKALQPPSANVISTIRAVGVKVVRRIIEGRFSPPIMAVSGRAAFFADQGIDQHQSDTNHDRRVGDVEGGPMPLAHVEI